MRLLVESLQQRVRTYITCCSQKDAERGVEFQWRRMLREAYYPDKNSDVFNGLSNWKKDVVHFEQASPASVMLYGNAVSCGRNAVPFLSERNVVHEEPFLLRGLLSIVYCQEDKIVSDSLVALRRKLLFGPWFFNGEECHSLRTVPVEESAGRLWVRHEETPYTVISGERCNTRRVRHGREDMEHGVLCPIDRNAVLGVLRQST
jgi:hypothetical protein